MNRIALLIVGLAATGGLLVAGPLSPPAGPVASTYKTLADIEPRVALSDLNTPGHAYAHYVITQPGSYYLAGNLQVTKMFGIDIQASNVTLDLGGFVVSRAHPSAEYGVRCYSDGLETYSNVTIRNGTVAGAFTGSGAYSDAPFTTIEHVRAINITSGFGIGVGRDGTVRHSVAKGCVNGISGGARSVIEHVVVSECSQIGVVIGNGTVRESMISQCSQYGIHCYGNGVVLNNILRDNLPGGGAGIFINGIGARIEGNTVSGSWWGIMIGSNATDCLVIRNMVRRGGGTAIGMSGQAAGSFPNNHVAAIIADPASPFSNTNAFSNIQY
ncbi:MAG: right-handed parallel beta-helix repeat-containing protein [Phycisphaeraceae bacterium]|nr:MAG: right-handed parallel beta-helix repeat-containing protein [Phycisphaeraceae bacterium]